MKSIFWTLGAGVLILMVCGTASAGSGQIYGKIYTDDNEVFEGFIRWDMNEGSWHDILDGTKELDRERGKRYYRDKDRRDKSISIFGLTIYDEGDGNFFFTDAAESGVMMGHIKTLMPDGDNEVVLVLKSGEEVYLEGGSTDIGDDIREIVIKDVKEGELELYWSDIDKVEFMQAPANAEGFGKRLYGTVMTRRGDEFTGFISWDVDEIFDGDILDGRESSRKRKIEFGKIDKIERRSSNSAIVTLEGGSEMRLSESNDIDSGNRGVCIYDKNLGRITVDWDEFDAIDFSEHPAEPQYSDFDGGKQLHGTVTAENGKTYTGRIKWDDDEEYTWELLDGKYNDVDLDIEFDKIASIERKSRSSSVVTLKDGRQLRLRDSNDIDDDNKGIFIFEGNDKEGVMVDWYDFEKVVFDQ